MVILTVILRGKWRFFSVTAEEIVKSRATGRWLCILFCNTVENFRLEVLNDEIPDFAAWVQWSVKHGIVSAPVGRGLELWAEARPGAAALALTNARELRLQLFQLFSACAAGKTPEAKELVFLNDRISEALGHLELSSTDADMHLNFRDSTVPDRMLWPVVYSAVQLLTDRDRARMRRCGGDKCTWMFIDESKNGSRRWCDMSICGNRAKSRKHYQKARNAASS